MSTDDDYGHDQRSRALALTEAELRRRVDVLLEQCGREALLPAHVDLPRPIGPYLYISEILMLLGVGRAPSYDELNEVLRDAQADNGPFGKPIPEDLQKEVFNRLHERSERAAYEADPEGWIRDHTVGGIRPHIPPRPGDDRRQFEVEFPGYCADGTCGVCGACLLRRDGG